MIFTGTDFSKVKTTTRGSQEKWVIGALVVCRVLWWSGFVCGPFLIHFITVVEDTYWDCLLPKRVQHGIAVTTRPVINTKTYQPWATEDAAMFLWINHLIKFNRVVPKLLSLHHMENEPLFSFYYQPAVYNFLDHIWPKVPGDFGRLCCPQNVYQQIIILW